MPECTVQLWYNKRRIKNDGKVSLYLQIIIGGEHSEVRIKNLEWPANKIDWNKKAIQPRHKEDQDFNTYQAVIERERAKYWTAVMGFLKQDMPFKLSDVFREVNLYKSGHHFCDFMENAIKARQKTLVKKDMIKDTTAKVHRCTLKYFREFLGNHDIEITAVNGDLLEQFANWSRKSITENSVWVRVQNIKSYISYAFRNKIAVNNDYKRCVITMDEADPTWLDPDEVKGLLALYKSDKITETNRRNLRAFLFAAFTGLRISDLSRWNKDWIFNDHIAFIPQKRKKSAKQARPLIIPILPIARQFINDLKAETFELPKEQVYNRELKAIAVAAGIKKNITSHVARHTFATSLAIDDVPQLAISKLLGHKSIVTTMLYVHIAENYLARHMMKLQNRYGDTLSGDDDKT